MGGIFSSSSSSSNGSSKKKKKPAKPGGTISATDRAVLDLKNSRDRLSRYRSKLEADQQKLLERAKKCQDAGDKRMAINLLKLRKHKLNEATNVENQLLNVLQLVDTISSKENEIEMLNAMKSGKEALDNLHREMTVDDVLNLMDEVQEQGEVEREISAILSTGAQLSAQDESEVEAELAALQKEMEAEAAKVTEETLPEVPATELPKLAEKEEKKQTTEDKRVMVPA